LNQRSLTLQDTIAAHQHGGSVKTVALPVAPEVEVPSAAEINDESGRIARVRLTWWV
jgi:hypothetical protein